MSAQLNEALGCVFDVLLLSSKHPENIRSIKDNIAFPKTDLFFTRATRFGSKRFGCVMWLMAANGIAGEKMSWQAVLCNWTALVVFNWNLFHLFYIYEFPFYKNAKTLSNTLSQIVLQKMQRKIMYPLITTWCTIKPVVQVARWGGTY